jgi:iron(II)-dependent oxidoreductase
VAQWRARSHGAWPGHLRAHEDAASLGGVLHALARFREDPLRWAEPLRLFAARVPEREALAARLLAEATPAAVLLSADLGVTVGLADALLALLGTTDVPAARRARAGRHLARLGDPRDLEELCTVPSGTLTMGSRHHPNSMPVHQVRMAGYRIGRYPVTNLVYRGFVAATGRPWRSASGPDAERANHPAVDLTWRDAVACCAWLTNVWRASGRIAPGDVVRLPTEPEWEYAARLERSDGEDIVYPWPGSWQPDRANGEDAGFNDVCAVGLFPAGRSPVGCDDMAGQVWEWCSTLWGAGMARPSWTYPTRDDGREAEDAPPDLRRVLRGGCFSSGPAKANATYRGSLEPDGFWRGNGFRVVVSAAATAPSG